MKYISLIIITTNMALANGYKHHSGSTGTYTGYTNSGNSYITNYGSGGNMNGVDSSGNSWSYEKTSGAYINSNGKTCIGHGEARVCN